MEDARWNGRPPDRQRSTVYWARARRRRQRRRVLWSLGTIGALAGAATLLLVQLGIIPTMATARPPTACASECTNAGQPTVPVPSDAGGPPSAGPSTGRGPRPTTAAKVFSAWAKLDRHTLAISGSDNLGATNSTESMVKAWIAGDDLRGLTEHGIEPDAAEKQILTRMIRDSDDNAAETIYRRNGSDAVITRLIKTCGLTDTRVFHSWWSLTEMSPRDATRMGLCVADGRAAGPQWTSWLLNEMRNVRGEGRFGIVNAFPANVASQLSIKNGWTLHTVDGMWHVNCLAIAKDWILAVGIRYPAGVGGLSYGATYCADIARKTVLV